MAGCCRDQRRAGVPTGADGGQRVQVGPLSPFSAAQIVKAYAKRAGLDPVQFAGHSLRSGFLTSAAENGASVFKMMEVSRHRSVDTLRGYGRRADLFHEHAGAGVPLTPKGQPRPLINAGMRRACEVNAGHRLPERPA